MPRTPPDGSSSPLLSANRDAVSLSTEARRAAERFRARGPESTGAGEKDQAGQPLTENQRRQLATLEEQDRAIRRHEEAHRAAAGGLVRGGISYRYRVGPDGKRYAVHGDVDIDLTAEASPEATIRKMQRARRAATAPASPSPQDRAIAALARQREDRAREALREERIESARGAREERSDAMRAEGDGASEAAGPGSGGEGAPEGLRALAALAAGLRPGQNPRTGVAKLADFTQGAAGPAEMARRLEALRQYQRASRPELFVAEGKAMQPARPHAVGGFVVTSLESPLHRAR
jgi:hypothetical protein